MKLPADAEKIDKVTASAWLRALRVDAGIERRDLEEVIGRSYRTILNAENGRPSTATIATLRYLKAVGVLPDAPVALPNLGRLGELERKLVATQDLIARGFLALGVELALPDEEPPPQAARVRSTRRAGSG